MVTADIPASVAWGRRAFFDASTNGIVLAGLVYVEYWLNGNRLSVTETTQEPFAGETSLKFFVQVDAPEPAATLELRWGDVLQSGCYHALAQEIAAGPGRNIVLPWKWDTTGSTEFSDHRGDETLAFALPSGNCANVTPGHRVRVQLIPVQKIGRKKFKPFARSSWKTLSIADQCDAGSLNRSLHVRGGVNYGDLNTYGVYFRGVTANLNRTSRLRVIVKVDNKVVSRRRLYADWRRYWLPAKTVWQGTDAFINFCINDNREIRSAGGRLYCDGDKYYDMTFAARPDSGRWR